MNVVVDTSVIIAVIANEPERDYLVESTVGVGIIAPASCHYEIGNALSAMIRRRRIGVDHARQAVEAYQRIPLRFVDVDLTQAVELANTLGIYAYDAYVIGCALNQKCPLISLDRGLVSAARVAGAEVLEARA